MTALKRKIFLFNVIIFSLGLSLLASPANAAEVWGICRPLELGVFADRVQVRCLTPLEGKYEYIAVATADAVKADRFLNVMFTLINNNRGFRVFYEQTDTSGSAWGCPAVNCRNVRAYVMVTPTGRL